MEALLFFSLALYGALHLVWFGVKKLQRHEAQSPHPMTLILVVENAERHIEGVLRSLMMNTAFSHRERRIVVIDVASSDETANIVKRICWQLTAVDYLYAETDADFMEQLKSLLLHTPRVGCVYDLRVKCMAKDVAADIIGLCR